MSLTLNMVGAGGSAELPGIYVEYPEGSVCTCSKGSKTYTAKDTSGYWLFAGLEVGTWTLTISDPTGTYEDNSTTVIITNVREVVSIELYYGVYFFKEGEGPSSGWYKRYTSGSANYHIGNNYLESVSNGGCAIVSKNGVNLKEVNLIKVECMVQNSAGGKFYLTSGASDPTNVLAGAYTKTYGVREVIELDVSGYPGTAYGFDIEAITNGGSFKVYNIKFY